MSDKFLRSSAYIWTACSAGWFVLYIVTDVREALAVCLGCAALAWFFSFTGVGK